MEFEKLRRFAKAALLPKLLYSKERVYKNLHGQDYVTNHGRKVRACVCACVEGKATCGKLPRKADYRFCV